MKGVEGVDFKRVVIKNGARAGKVIEIPIRRKGAARVVKVATAAEVVPAALKLAAEERAAGGALPAWVPVVAGVVVGFVVVTAVLRLRVGAAAEPAGEGSNVIPFTAAARE